MFERKYWSKEYDFSKNVALHEKKVHHEISNNCKLGIIEIGVFCGITSKILSEANPNIPVYGIDPIIPDSMNVKATGNLDEIKKNTKNCKNYSLIKDYSFNTIKNWNKPFDYLFIDGDHNYVAVKKDYEDWLPKLEKGGTVSFHDSTMNRSNWKYWPGPSKLTDEIIKSDTRVKFIESIGSLTIFKKI